MNAQRHPITILLIRRDGAALDSGSTGVVQRLARRHPAQPANRGCCRFDVSGVPPPTRTMPPGCDIAEDPRRASYNS